MRAGMRSHPGTGWFVALVVTTLLVVGWPRVDHETRAARQSEWWPPAAGGVDNETRAARQSEWWQPESGGFALRVPNGWKVVASGDQSMLIRECGGVFAGKVGAVSRPDASRVRDCSGVEAIVDALSRGGSYHPLRSQRLVFGGCPVLRVDWESRSLGPSHPQRGIDLFCDRGAARLSMQFAADVAEWPHVEREFEAMIQGLAIEPVD